MMPPLHRNIVLLLVAAATAAACSDDDKSPKPDQLPVDMAAQDARVADGKAPDLAVATDGSAGLCPVVGFKACGGDLLGSWDVVSFCPEDAAAAAALFEHPFDNLQQCKDRTKNTVDAVVTEVGTMTFTASELTSKVTSTHDLTYGFTDACLAAAFPAAPDPKTACLDQQKSGKLTCTYQPDRCVCVGQLVHPGQEEKNPYEQVGTTQIKMGNVLADYCRTGPVLILDWEKHPISWRYWILKQP
jgi:hypothetical protein